MKTIDILKKARKLITTSSKWTKGVLAGDKDGVPVPPCDRRAVCWCASGAIIKAAGGVWKAGPAWRPLEDLLFKMQWRHSIPDSIPGFNDNSTHKQVLALFDKAIKSLK